MIRSTGRKRLLAVTSLVAGVTLLAAGCGGGDDEGSGDGTKSPAAAEGTDTDRTLIVWAGAEPPITANFNPFSPTLLAGTNGVIYETLFYYNKTSAEAPRPMLGESFEWNEDGTELTIKLREGVKWNDGEDFTADDVVFSLTNKFTTRAYITGAEAVDPLTVKVSFDGPEFTNEFSVLGTTLMVPEHVWAEKEADVEAALTWTNEDAPVGTGPYTVGETSADSYTFEANPDYWGGKPKVAQARYIGVAGNQSAQDMLTTGQIDWTGMFIPDPDSIVSSSGDAVGYVNTPQDPTAIYTCANVDLGCEGPQTDVAVRQALNVAIDRTEINNKAFVDLAAPVSPTFALLGRDDKWIADGMPKESPQTANAEEAMKILEDAGYTKGADGIYEKDGQKVEMTLTSPATWTDYNSTNKLVAAQALKAGIKIDVTEPTQQEWGDARFSGNFQLTLGGIVGTSVPDPFQIYKDWFTTDATIKVGETLEPGDWNFTRYSNPAVDEAVNAAAATNDEAAKKDAYAKVQAEITEDLPYIPVVVNATETFWNAKDYTGWPTEDNLYAFPPAWGAGASGLILSQLGGTE
ncbi:peptide/nickel transport system substrate-binding protein [Sediminihabitans luteus]|uniref:Peptide/nickel transport system substrate-binding protein n=1 Tax=Sediminihabitans luteus TaxID=1138585 RepID=A0A2M9D099_9CELL|nr:ABC transporter substrate-binding protein [Sediminihabitans luteus]PJJ77614.1 peptide/nickel transport system substrate-binding protein [Sediminihabitans luteus]GII98514.1 peptide ABC transporter substrate-binding protein [Sediminihabitans luteus]